MYGTPAGHGPNTYVGLHVPHAQHAQLDILHHASRKVKHSYQADLSYTT